MNSLFGKSGKGKSEEGSSKSSRDWKQNRKTKLKFSYKEQKEFETIDDDIAQLEDGIAALEAEILANATNPGKLNELMKEKEKAEHALEEKMNRWVYLNDLAESNTGNTVSCNKHDWRYRLCQSRKNSICTI